MRHYCTTGLLCPEAKATSAPFGKIEAKVQSRVTTFKGYVEEASMPWAEEGSNLTGSGLTGFRDPEVLGC